MFPGLFLLEFPGRGMGTPYPGFIKGADGFVIHFTFDEGLLFRLVQGQLAQRASLPDAQVCIVASASVGIELRKA